MVFPIIIKNFKFIEDFKILKLSLNIDGLPLSTSSKSNVWPILLSIINVPELQKIVIPVGIYHGLIKKTWFRTRVFRSIYIGIKTINQREY